ncbi:MAG: trehalose-phosphatase [Gemmatimonadota bacterium]|nr:trehalose-phosphatase [Gemmatimonadota bacterium]
MSPSSSIRSLPSALARQDEIAERMAGRTPVVFLDYDGTLTPIVDDPAKATLPPGTRDAIDHLKTRCSVAIISGRTLDEVREMVGVERIHYVGSHGFEIRDPDGTLHHKGEEYLPALARSAERLERRLEDIRGTWVERKGFAVAVHYRRLEDPEQEPLVAAAVDRTAREEPSLRKTSGKKVHELRPGMEWDKGKALLWVLDVLGADADGHIPLYIGDDLTDEDAFRALADRGIGIVVEGEDDRDTVADYSLSDPDAVRRFLEALAALRDDASSDRP